MCTACKRSLGQVNALTPMCDSVHRGVGFPACTGKGVGFQACNGKGGLVSQHALGRGDWFPSMHLGRKGWLPSMHWKGELASQHAPELGKVGAMHPPGIFSCRFYFQNTRYCLKGRQKHK